MKSMSAETVRRWRPFGVALLAIALVAVFPSHHGGHRAVKTGEAARTPEATTSTTAAAATQETAPAGAQPAAAQAPKSGNTTGAVAGATTKTTAGAARKNTSVSGLDARAVTAAPAVTGAGINTPAALAAPDCDAAAKR